MDTFGPLPGAKFHRYPPHPNIVTVTLLGGMDNIGKWVRGLYNCKEGEQLFVFFGGGGGGW